MKYRYFTPKSTGIDITPLLDIVFLVLIFFMVGASFELNRALQMTLPQSFTSEGVISPEKILIEIDNTGRIAVNGTSSALQELSQVINSLSITDETNVYILADNAVPYKHVIEVMDILKILGIEKISLVTSAKKDI